MKVLLACEFSNIGSQAFRDLGHTVYSVDKLENEQPELSEGFHYTGDIFDFWDQRPCEFDLMIAHPPCTFLTNAAALHLWHDRALGIKNEERWANMIKGVKFFNKLWSLPVKKKCFENPVMVGHAKKLLDAGHQTQITQPYHHGILQTKQLCLWLRNLDKLKPTNDVKEETMALPYAQRAKVHYASPGPERWKERSRSFPAVMQAMAQQWGNL